jgi:hypothetical protein
MLVKKYRDFILLENDKPKLPFVSKVTYINPDIIESLPDLPKEEANDYIERFKSLSPEEQKEIIRAIEKKIPNESAIEDLGNFRVGDEFQKGVIDKVTKELMVGERDWYLGCLSSLLVIFSLWFFSGKTETSDGRTTGPYGVQYVSHPEDAPDNREDVLKFSEVNKKQKDDNKKSLKTTEADSGLEIEKQKKKAAEEAEKKQEELKKKMEEERRKRKKLELAKKAAEKKEKERLLKIGKSIPVIKSPNKNKNIEG